MTTTTPDDQLFGAEHVAVYRETDGDRGHAWRGTTTLLLTTTGRKSGRTRTTPLIYQAYGDDYLIVASKGGAPEPPEWYLNLLEQPEVEVQIRDDVFTARARTASDEEKPDMWATMRATWPAYDDYQEKTDRSIPVVVLEREG